ncbi:hypothetical protein FBF37_03335 [Candidatus Nanosynbacter featherlites]|uniref:Protein kinase domain-containing protein n=2 Tax=Candidatus Nanosynbacter featherlites TaxID=2572088 RepID=A0A4P9A3R0_9BACT|nr:hypothetical protein FBF37_03335 [Candidatus Nanosynbacter featherlites]
MLAPLSTNWYITTMHRFDTYASCFEIDEHERVHKLGRHVLMCVTNPQIELMRQLMDEQPKHLLAPLAIRAVQGEPLHETYPLMGATLAEHKRAIQHQLDEGKMTAGTIVDMMMQVAEAAAYLHERGLVHHDIRPTNIFYDEIEGRPALTLFDYNQVKPPYVQTKPHSSWNREHAPEIAKSGSFIDYRFDVYAIGIVFHELTHDLIWESGSDFPEYRIKPALAQQKDLREIMAIATGPWEGRYSDARELHAALCAAKSRI